MGASTAATAAVAYSADAVVYHRRQVGEELPREETLRIPRPEALGPDGREALGTINPSGEDHLDLTVLRREVPGGAARPRRRRRPPLPEPALAPAGGGGPVEPADEKIRGSFLPAAGRTPGRRFELSRRPVTAEDWNELLVVYAGALLEQRERDANRARTEAARLLDAVEESLRTGASSKEDPPDLVRARHLAPLLDEEGLARLQRVEDRWERCRYHAENRDGAAPYEPGRRPDERERPGARHEDQEWLEPADDPDWGEEDRLEEELAEEEGTPEGPGAGSEAATGRGNPAPLLLGFLATLAAAGVLWFLFWPEGGGESAAARGAPFKQTAAVATADPFAGGPAQDTGVAFEPMQESGEKAKLSGAGLEWNGAVTEKGGGEGQTVTLDGPTAAQLERGFDIGDWDVEPGVYAVAQRDTGEVLHVTTQTLVPQDRAAAAEEKTLGTVYAFDDGEFTGLAYYLDERQEGTDKFTRTYFGPDLDKYRVSYEARDPKAAKDGDRNGAFVPLLVGWRGFEDAAGGGE